MTQPSVFRHRHPDLVNATCSLIREFRRFAVRNGYREVNRVGISRHMDQSIRFTNSTISPLKPRLESPVTEELFLVQPAVRLRNLDHWNARGKMSPVGCSLIAMGTLYPPGMLKQSVADAVRFLVEALGFEREQLSVSVPKVYVSEFRGAVPDVNLAVETDERISRYEYGMQGVSGIAVQISIKTRRETADAISVVSIERDGVPIAVETAFSANMLLSLRSELIHPVLATVGALAADYYVSALISLDCLGTAAMLMAEGLQPKARGREGRLRQLLRTCAAASGPVPVDWSVIASVLAEAEFTIRSCLSPVDSTVFSEVSSGELSHRMAVALSSYTAPS